MKHKHLTTIAVSILMGVAIVLASFARAESTEKGNSSVCCPFAKSQNSSCWSVEKNCVAGKCEDCKCKDCKCEDCKCSRTKGRVDVKCSQPNKEVNVENSKCSVGGCSCGNVCRLGNMCTCWFNA